MASNEEANDDAAHEFINSLDLTAICGVASSHRQGTACIPGHHTIGSFNIIQELDFDDGSTWLARIPRPDTSFQPEDTVLSYAAVLRYLKIHSSITVPVVYGYAVASDSENALGISYVLMEKLPGKALPTLDIPENQEWRESTSEELQLARKAHEQLTDIIIELGRHQFPQIGALRENSPGKFTIVEYFDPYFTGYPEERASTFRGMEDCDRGPYKSSSEFYSCISKLNVLQSQSGPEGEDTEGSVAEYKPLAEMIPKFIVPEFNNGPFVICHNDLTVQNILVKVDEDFNITGIIDFPGNVDPLQSLCGFPWMFYDNLGGPVTQRLDYLDVFTSRVSDCQPSALASQSLRRRLMDTALQRDKFEHALLGPYTSLVLPFLYKYAYGTDYRSRTEKLQSS